MLPTDSADSVSMIHYGDNSTGYGTKRKQKGRNALLHLCVHL